MKGKTASLRRTVRLAAGYQLQTAPPGSGGVLVSPKGPIPLNETATMILDLCNGTYTVEEIVAHVLSARGDSLEQDVRAFLDAALRRGWVVEN